MDTYGGGNTFKHVLLVLIERLGDQQCNSFDIGQAMWSKSSKSVDSKLPFSSLPTSKDPLPLRVISDNSRYCAR